MLTIHQLSPWIKLRNNLCCFIHGYEDQDYETQLLNGSGWRLDYERVKN